MTDDLRRQDDQLLSTLDKRLALLEQAHNLRADADATRSKLLEAQLGSLTAEVKAAITLWQNVTAEPAASPAGRALQGDIEEIRIKVEEHDDFIAQANGAIRLAKFAVGTSLLAAVGVVLQIILSIRALN